MKIMPAFKETALGVMQLLRGVQLGRMIVTRLKPGGTIAPHEDQGQVAKWYTRTHLVLAGKPGNMFTVEDETVQMLTGELWWFENKRSHSCVNKSDDDRVHLIMDVRVE
jgi:quercetin dioxygenase-like cupin family protein